MNDARTIRQQLNALNDEAEALEQLQHERHLLPHEQKQLRAVYEQIFSLNRRVLDIYCG